MTIRYTVGGTVQANQGFYVTRSADDELLALCRASTYAYILTARQLGKSSLMVRTAERLEDEGIRTALIDLTRLGAQTDEERWYQGVLFELADQLSLSVDVAHWWSSLAHLPTAQRLSRFCIEVLLAEIRAPVVIFFDEIDTTLSQGMDFTDDFFAAIRSLYNDRAKRPDLQRLSFVLIGVATPSDLIHDPKRTPFNIGTRVELEDFSLEEAAPFADGLGLPRKQTEATLVRVLHWTNGHPYLTQRLCRALLDDPADSAPGDAVDAAVRATFFGDESEKDHNLQFVRDMLTDRAPDKIAVLRLYRAVHSSRQPVADDEQSQLHAHLKLSGVVRRQGDKLEVRNRIYRTVFDQAWVKRHWPLNWWQTLPRAAKVASAIVVVSLVLLMGLATWLSQALDDSNQQRVIAQTAQANAEAAQADNLQQVSIARTALINAESAQASANAQRWAAVARALPPEREELALLIAYDAYSLDNDNHTTTALYERVSNRPWRITTLNGQDGRTAHTDSVNSAVFSPDGSRILTASDDHTASLWDQEGKLIKTLDGHSGVVTSAIFSPDGSYILTISNASTVDGTPDGTVRLWDERGVFLTTLNQKDIISAVFSPDSKYIVTASGDNTAHLWDERGNLVKKLEGHAGDVVSAVFAPGGKYILTASTDKMARLWDLDGKLVRTLEGHTGGVVSAVYAPDGTHIVTASRDNTAIVWDVAGTTAITLTGHVNDLVSAVFSPDSKRILTISMDNTARLWDLEGNSIAPMRHSDWLTGAIFSPDGRILTTSADNMAKLWDADGKPLAIIQGHTDVVHSAVFSPDGNRILTASADHTVRLWDWDSKIPPTLQGHTHFVEHVDISPDGERILTASQDNTARLWDKDGRPLAVLKDHTSLLTNIIFSPDGNRILTASADNTAKLWDLSGTPLITMTGHTDFVSSAIFSPDGKRILTASGDDTARLWDLEGNLLKTLEGHTSWIYSAVFSPDGNRILTASADKTARLWEADGKLRVILQGHTSWVYSAVFSPDGKRILTASADKTARLWDLDGKLLATLEGPDQPENQSHQSDVVSAVFSPNGNLILTASTDNTARLWDQDGKFIKTLEGHTGDVKSAIFSSDNEHIVTASTDNTARLWNQKGELIKTLEGHAGDVNSAIFSPDGRLILTASNDETARQYLVPNKDFASILLEAAQCRVGRELTDEELKAYMPDQSEITMQTAPKHFTWSERNCSASSAASSP